MEQLLKFGGFPEPLFKADERFWRRWQRERLSRVIYDDIRDLEQVKEISQLELLSKKLPNRVGSPLSIKNLSQVLSGSFRPKRLRQRGEKCPRASLSYFLQGTFTHLNPYPTISIYSSEK
jgi:predicted AAA+ superfamily ATPase